MEQQPPIAAALPPTSVKNRTFNQIAIGDSATTVRTLTPQDIELLAIVSGGTNPSHLDPADANADAFHGIIAQAMWGGGRLCCTDQ